ncbi:MAG TPA: DNA polymerase IV [Rectinemataceae bacterium]
MTKEPFRFIIHDMGGPYFHVDLDAFFASVEVLDNPALEGKPVIVGALPGSRGVVSTCSYEARAFGVHSAQPISEAYRLCPGGVFLPVRMERYAKKSREVMAILGEFTPDLRQLSIDEAAMDMGGTERLWGKPDMAAALLKRRVREATGLCVSVGVGWNRYVAKVASGVGKPDALTIVPSGREAEFMATLPLEKLWGAGEKTRQALLRQGFATIASLQSASQNILESAFGKAGGSFLHAAALGQDPGIFSAERSNSSMSGERTFMRDSSSLDEIEGVLRLISDELAARVIDADLSSRTACLKLRFDDFTTITRRMTRREPFSSSAEILESARELLKDVWDGRRPVRLIGLGLHGLEKGIHIQKGLFDAETEAQHRAERARKAVEDLKRKGLGGIQRARFIAPDLTRTRGGKGESPR